MDVLLQDKGDGGEVVLIGGDLQGDGSLYNSVYLSLFQGECFSNIFEEHETDNEFEELLSLPITMSNLKKVENKANKCLKWMIENGVANEIECYAHGNDDDVIEIEITVTEPSGNKYSFALVWENQKRVLRKI